MRYHAATNTRQRTAEDRRNTAMRALTAAVNTCEGCAAHPGEVCAPHLKQYKQITAAHLAAMAAAL